MDWHIDKIIRRMTTLLSQRIGTRLIAGFAALFLVMGISSAIGHRAVGQAQDQYAAVTEEAAPLRTYLATLASQVYQMSASLRGYGLYQDDQYLKAYDRAVQKADEALASAEVLRMPAADREALERVADLLHHFKIINQSMTTLSSGGANATAIRILEKGLPVLEEFSMKVAALQEQVDRRVLADFAAARDQAQMARNLAMLSSGAGLVLLVLLGYFLTRSISRPLRGLAVVARQVAGGDLSPKPLPATVGDEIGDLSHAFAAMTSSLREAVALMLQAGGQLMESSALLSGTASQSARNAHAILNRLEQVTREWHEQGVRLEAAACEIGELRGAISQVADGAKEQAEAVAHAGELMRRVVTTVGRVAALGNQVAAAAQGAYERAEVGGRAVQEMAAGMERVRETAQRSTEAMSNLSAQVGRIQEMAHLIEEIARQTSLLALNAAIEAARAGEAGRGFAVVAAEVGSLSQRSTQATKEIADLVKSIQMRSVVATEASALVSLEVTGGADRASAAGSALHEILAHMKMVVAQTESIAAGVREVVEHAASASRSVSTAAAITEQTAAASGQMRFSADQIAAAMGAVTQTLNQNRTMATAVLASTTEMAGSVTEVEAAAKDLSSLAGAFGEIGGRFAV